MPRDTTDWVGAWPVELAILASLGKAGFFCKPSATYCRSIMLHVRTRNGNIPSIDAFKARMGHKTRYSEEMENFEKAKPEEVAEGRRKALPIQDHLLSIGIKPSLHIPTSPGRSEHLSTEINKKRREVRILNNRNHRPKGDKRVQDF